MNVKYENVLIEDCPKVKGSNRDGGSTVMCLEAVDASNVSLSAIHTSLLYDLIRESNRLLYTKGWDIESRLGLLYLPRILELMLLTLLCV